MVEKEQTGGLRRLREFTAGYLREGDGINITWKKRFVGTTQKCVLAAEKREARKEPEPGGVKIDKDEEGERH